MQRRTYQFGFVVAFAGLMFCLWWSRRRASVIDKQEITAQAVESEEPRSATIGSQAQPNSELLRLRGEVAVLRVTVREQTNTAISTSSSSISDRLISSHQFADAGFSAPELAVQTICWAAFTTNKDRYKQGIVWGDEAIKIARGPQKEDFDTNNIFFTVANPGGHTRAFEILGVRPIAPDHMLATVLIVRGDEVSETREKRHMELINVNGEWKWLVPSPADVGIIPFISE